MPRMPTSVLTPKRFSISSRPPEYDDDAKEIHSVATAIVMVTIQRYPLDQLYGFCGGCQ